MSSDPQQTTPDVDDAGRVGQADDLVERVTTNVSSVVARAVARAREEAEDIWVEAKTVRHGDRPGAKA